MRFNIPTINLCMLVGLLLLASCNKKVTGETPNQISYDTLKTINIYHLDNDSTKPSCSLEVTYIAPVKYEKRDVLGKIQSELNFNLFEDDSFSQLSPQEALDKYKTSYEENYKKDVLERFPDWKESGETMDYFSYYKKINTEVTFDKGHILSYRITSRDYRGGASSSTFVQNLVFNLSTGARLMEDDIFENGYKDKLAALFTTEILRQNKVKTTDELMNDLGFFGIEDIPFNNNFAVDENGIIYTFNEGEIAPPSVGAITINMQYENILPILKKDSPIAIFFKEQ